MRDLIQGNCIVYTVASTDYLTQALATIKSVHKHNPTFSYFIFLVDLSKEDSVDLSLKLNEELDFEVDLLGYYSLDVEDTRLFEKSLKYFNKFEICCLMKYLAACFLFKNYCDRYENCIFLDADTYVVSSFSAVLADVKQYALSLTPHEIGPSQSQREIEYLFQGWINAGFFIINFRNSVLNQILNWLKYRIVCHGFYAPEYDICGEQQWLSFLPLIFPNEVHILQDVGLNVAYWNLDHRKLSRTESGVKVNNEELFFLHYSGRQSKSMYLSKHSKFLLNSCTVLCELTAEYDELVLNTMSYEVRSSISFINKNISFRLKQGSSMNETSIRVNPLFSNRIFLLYHFFFKHTKKLKLW